MILRYQYYLFMDSTLYFFMDEICVDLKNKYDIELILYDQCLWNSMLNEHMNKHSNTRMEILVEDIIHKLNHLYGIQVNARDRRAWVRCVNNVKMPDIEDLSDEIEYISDDESFQIINTEERKDVQTCFMFGLIGLMILTVVLSSPADFIPFTGRADLL